MHNGMNNEAILKELGARLKNLRLSRNVGQEQFSKVSGVSLRTLSRLENGSAVSIDAVLNVMRALEIVDRLESMLPLEEISPVQMLQTQKKKRAVPRQRATRTQASTLGEQLPWSGFGQQVRFVDRDAG